MRKKHFDAILAKNDMAREIRTLIETGDCSINFIQYMLKVIEDWIGEGNQPSVQEIWESKIEI